MSKRTAKLADLGMILVTVIWGYGFIATRVAVEHYTASFTIFYRFLIGSIILIFASLGKFKDIKRKDLRNGAILGFFLYAGFILQTIAINYTTVAKNAFLTTLNVIIVPLIVAAVHKERVDKFSAAGCVLAICGTGILSLNMDLSVNIGDLLSIMCAVFFSFHIFFQSEFVKQTNASILVTLQLMFACVFAFFPALAGGGVAITVVNPAGLMGILYLGVLSTCFCLFLQAVCQKYTSPVKAVIIFSLEAVFASIFAVIFLGDELTPRFIAGSTIIFAAVIISTTKLSFLWKKCEMKIIDKNEPIV